MNTFSNYSVLHLGCRKHMVYSAVSVYLCITVSDQSRFSLSCSSLNAASFDASTPLKKSFGVSMESVVWKLYFAFTCLLYTAVEHLLNCKNKSVRLIDYNQCRTRAPKQHQTTANAAVILTVTWCDPGLSCHAHIFYGNE